MLEVERGIATKNGELTGQPKLLNEREAAEYFGVEPRTIRLWRNKGLPFIRLTSKVVRFRQPDLNEWVAARRTVIGQ